MRLDRTCLALASLLGSTAAFSGKATTTRYYDGQMGACGCGNGSTLYPWQTGLGHGIYTAAGSQAFFDKGGSSWCGPGCGKCYKLTSTGRAPPGQGSGGDKGKSIIVMITNLCPNSGNERWCPNPGQKNQYGYEYHFDIMAKDYSIPQVFGDNPIVNFESIPCPATAKQHYQQCECAHM